MENFRKAYRYKFKLKVTAYNTVNWDSHKEGPLYILDVTDPDPPLYVPNFAPIFKNDL